MIGGMPGGPAGASVDDIVGNKANRERAHNLPRPQSAHSYAFADHRVGSSKTKASYAALAGGEEKSDRGQMYL